MERPNLLSAYRKARRDGFNRYLAAPDCPGVAAYALTRARAALLAYRNAAAEYEDSAVACDAARVAANESKAAAQSLARAGGTPYESAAQEVTERVAALAAAERRKAAALKAITTARKAAGAYAAPWGDSDYGAGTWQGNFGTYDSKAAQEAARERDAATRRAAPFQGVPPAMRGPSHARFPGFRCMDSRRERGGLFAYHDGAAVFRDVRDAEDIPGGNPDRATGYYDNPYGESARDGSGLVIPVVARLQGRDGCARFAPGYRFGGHDDAGTFDLSAVVTFDSRGLAWDDDSEGWRDAARIAHGMAESAAEEEREYQTAWQAGSRWADAGERLAEVRAEVRAILSERRAAAATGAAFRALCAAITARVESLLQERAELMQERADLKAGDSDSLYFWPGDTRLAAAFQEGAGL